MEPPKILKAPLMIGGRPTTEIVTEAIFHALERNPSYFLFTIKAFAGQEIADAARAATGNGKNPDFDYGWMVEEGIRRLLDSGDIEPVPEASWYTSHETRQIALSKRIHEHCRYKRVDVLDKLARL